MKGVPFAPREVVRVGIAGLGLRGRGLLGELLSLDGVEVVALFDPSEAALARAQARAAEAGSRPLTLCPRYEDLIGRDDLDLALIATPWDEHAPMAAAAMEAGKHAAVEVPAAMTIDECWRLVEMSERTKRHCVMLENSCYGRTERIVRQMARAGRFGLLTHAECGYVHLWRDGFLVGDPARRAWVRRWHMRRNGNLYPTHGLGPVALSLGIHEGDRFTMLVSVSSREASLSAFRDERVPAGDPLHDERYLCGDRNISILKTAQGRTVLLQHDVVTPRPYSRLSSLQGTKGAFVDEPPRVYFDGFEPREWRPLDTVAAECDDLPESESVDRAILAHLVQCLRDGLPPEMDVYDAAAWSAPGPLSAESVARGSAPLPFPDFTRGHWREAT